MDIFDQIRDAYNNGGALTPQMLEDLKKSFKVRDDFNKLFSLDVETSPKKMKGILEKNGYTLEVLKNLRFGVKDTDLDKLNVFIAAMNDNTDEYYVSFAVYLNHMTNDRVDFKKNDVFNLCIDKLVSKGYSEENIVKAINDYSSTGQFDLGTSKGIVVKLVRTKAPVIEEKKEGNVPLKITDIDKKEKVEDKSEEDKFSSRIDSLFNKFIEENPDLADEFKGDVPPKQPESTLENDVSKPDVPDNSSQKEEINEQPISSFNGQDINPFDSTYNAQRIEYREPIDIPSDVDYIGDIDYSKPNDFVEMPNPFEVPYEGTFKKISKIAKKVKRKITKPDFSKLKMKMLKSFLKLMKVDPNVLESTEENSFDYSWDHDMNKEGRSR